MVLIKLLPGQPALDHRASVHAFFRSDGEVNMDHHGTD